MGYWFFVVAKYIMRVENDSERWRKLNVADEGIKKRLNTLYCIEKLHINCDRVENMKILKWLKLFVAIFLAVKNFDWYGGMSSGMNVTKRKKEFK